MTYIWREDRVVRRIDLLEIPRVQEILPQRILQVPEFIKAVLFRLRRFRFGCTSTGAEAAAKGQQHP